MQEQNATDRGKLNLLNCLFAVSSYTSLFLKVGMSTSHPTQMHEQTGKGQTSRSSSEAPSQIGNQNCKKNIRAKTMVPYPQLCNFLLYFTWSNPWCCMCLHPYVVWSWPGRWAWAARRGNWPTGRGRIGLEIMPKPFGISVVMYASGLWLTPFWSISSSQVGLKMVKGWLSDCSCSLLPVTLCRERLYRNLPQKKS